MAEAAAEVGVKVGDLDVASMISIQPTEVLEPGKWVEHIDQGILIVAGATCPHGVIVYCARPLPQPTNQIYGVYKVQDRGKSRLSLSK